MKKITMIALAGILALGMASDIIAQRVVILHTNDTHSQIDPDKNNQGGVLRRKVLIDSVRAAEPNVMLVDAGDAVQGSLFFTLFDGEVEQMMLNKLGYDIQIVGNHEFDNGLTKLAQQYATAEPTLLATNYDFTGTPLEGMFVPYVIKEAGGKRIGFIGINIEPRGLIDSDNYAGLKYFDSGKTAEAMARYLKENLAVDKVVALTHIGFNSSKVTDDKDIAGETSYIDIIIGGHSHEGVYPGNPNDLPTAVGNHDGRPVYIAQMGKAGLLLGEITIDFDKPEGEQVSRRAIPVNDRLDSRITTDDIALLAPYRSRVDSISAIEIGTTAGEMISGSDELSNFLSDWVKSRGEKIAGRKVDFGLLNRGGIRNSLPGGTLTQGNIINMLPFNNRIVVVDITGDKLLELMDIIAGQGGQAFSGEVSGRYDRKNNKMVSVKINGKDIDPKRVYTVATIDYLQRGGDSMFPLTESTLIARSPNLLYRDLIEEFTDGDFKGKTVKGSPKPRLTPVK
ncbi:MAG: bifunctional metallophosphatase/5'-nucleotidase [Muribaculaceae bacterium]|nr:bifunctional metallophosphatase/5'-nucleotidase [Muribaculaceae bacterium]